MCAVNEVVFEMLDDEDPYEFAAVWEGIPIEKIKREPFHDADMYDSMLAAGAFKEEEDAENCED